MGSVPEIRKTFKIYNKYNTQWISKRIVPEIGKKRSNCTTNTMYNKLVEKNVPDMGKDTFKMYSKYIAQ